MKSPKEEMMCSGEGNIKSILTDSLNKINKNLNAINKHHDFDFSRAFNIAKKKLDKMINGNNYFSYGKYFKKEHNSPKTRKQRKRSSYYYRRRTSMTSISLNNQSQSGNEISLLTPDNSSHKQLSLLSPTSKNNSSSKRNYISHPKTQQDNHHNKNNTFLNKQYEKEFTMNQTKYHSQLNSNSKGERTSTSINTNSKYNFPLILSNKENNKNIKAFVLETKTPKNQFYKGNIFNSSKHTSSFIEALKQFASEHNTPLHIRKNTFNKAITDRDLIPHSVLTNIYLKCVDEIKNGEYIDNYILRSKNADKVNKEKREKLINSSNQQIEEMLMLDDNNNNNDQKKITLENMFNRKSECINTHEKSLNKQFQNKVRRIDVIPKISETLAFKNRIGYFSEFDYDYTNDGDFLFMKEFNKIRTANVNVDEFGNEIKQERNAGNNFLKDEQGIEYILEESEKDKMLLIRHIEDSQVKYKQKGYLTLKQKEGNNVNIQRRKNKNKNEQYINIKDYMKYMMKNTNYTNDEEGNQGRNNAEYFKTFRKTNSMPFIFSSTSTTNNNNY